MGKVKGATEGYDPATVEEKTGQTLGHWHKVLDAFDVAKNGHRAAAEHLRRNHGVSHWWAQNLTIQYEQAKGLRVPGQRDKGRFAVNVSKTVGVSPEKAFAAWATPEAWNSWFTSGAKVDFREGGRYENDDKDAGQFRRIKGPSAKNNYGEVARIEFTWENAEHCPGSIVTVQFIEKQPDKTQVALTHDRLPGPEGCADMKDGWGWALTSLKSWLETGKGVPYEEWKASQAPGDPGTPAS